MTLWISESCEPPGASETEPGWSAKVTHSFQKLGHAHLWSLLAPL